MYGRDRARHSCVVIGQDTRKKSSNTRMSCPITLDHDCTLHVYIKPSLMLLCTSGAIYNPRL